MKWYRIHISWLLLFLLHVAHAQKERALGYAIEGDEVVFTFTVSDYKKATKDNTSREIDFSDIDIYDVAVSGEFNGWSRKGWKMKKMGAQTYELRKRLADFDRAFSWEFKFIVNEKYWAEPGKDSKNIVQATKDGSSLQVYNLKMYTAFPSESGNVCFHLAGYPQAKKVIVTGSFNRWSETDFEMKKTPTGWELLVQLPVGEYEYKFIVDGKWMHDPVNGEKRLNEFLNYNSVLTVTKPVDFILKGYTGAQRVVLSGSFNNWNTESVVMKKTTEGWAITLELKRGKIQYKYIVDGDWITDPANPVKERDRYGHINSVKMIE
jgi:hypothetical protein